MSTARTIRRFSDETGRRRDAGALPAGGDVGAVGCQRAGLAVHRAALTGRARRGGRGGRRRPCDDRAGLRHGAPDARRRQSRGLVTTGRPTNCTTGPASSRRCCSPTSGSTRHRSCCSAARSTRRCRTSCWRPTPRARCLPDQLGVVRRRAAAARAVGVPEDWMLAGHIVVGWPHGRHGPVRRRPLGGVVCLDRWEAPASLVDVLDTEA